MEYRHRYKHNEKTHEVDFTLQPMRLNLLQGLILNLKIVYLKFLNYLWLIDF
jgi:hypothetical protein